MEIQPTEIELSTIIKKDDNVWCRKNSI
jgi:hypothetical protein